MARILITSAIPYINGIKHLGNLVGSQLPADLYARYNRLRGNEVMFICATDEHGTPAELAAAKVNKPIDTSKAAAIAANKSSPDLIPAAILAAEMHMLDNNKRASTKILKKTWGLNPHPDLATAFAEINLKETSGERRKRFSSFVKLKSEHYETKLLLTELAIGDEDFPAARRAIKDLTSTNPTVRSLALMAAIEKGEGADEKTVRAWLNKALTASRGPQWICEKCSNIHSSWQPRCENCETFDSLSWKAPPRDAKKITNEKLDFTEGILTGVENSLPPVSDIDDAEVVND